MLGEARTQALAALQDDLKKQGIRYVQIETPDINGTLRGKLVKLEKAMSPSGGAFCTILYGLSVQDEVIESRYSSFANGFPDAFAITDPSTVAMLDPTNGIASVVCDMAAGDRQSYYALSPRTALRRVADKAARLGYEARFAIELELFVVRTDRDLIASGAIHDQQSLGRIHNAYSLARMDELRSLAAEFMDRMAAVNVGIEAVHTELGHGLIEIAVAHAPPLAAADACARLRLYLRDFLSARGYSPVFMPKWRMEESGCGGHVHQSLWRDGNPAFADEDGGFSNLGRHYVAGLLDTMQDFSTVFYPTVNAYRRMSAMTWAPENVSWGMDNRTCALRVIVQPNPGACRIEHRCPGADINPYLAIACMLAGGLAGIEAGREPPAPVSGNSLDTPNLPSLPRNLRDAIGLFEKSTIAPEMLGKEIVEQYLLTRRTEADLWDEANRNAVSPWELARYFDLH